jgi:hypothetical protein
MKKLKRLWWFWVMCGGIWLFAAAPVFAMQCVSPVVQYVIICEHDVCQPAYKIAWQYRLEGCRTVPYVGDVTSEDESAVGLILEATEFRGRDDIYLLSTDWDFIYYLNRTGTADAEAYERAVQITERPGEKTLEEWQKYDRRQSWGGRTRFFIGFWLPMLLVVGIFGIGVNRRFLRPRVRAYEPVRFAWIWVTVFRMIVAGICFLIGSPGLERFGLASIILVLYMLVELLLLFGTIIWRSYKRAATERA